MGGISIVALLNILFKLQTNASTHLNSLFLIERKKERKRCRDRQPHTHIHIYILSQREIFIIYIIYTDCYL